MAKLWFRHGVVSSSKSLQLLAVAHNYEREQNKKVICIKPKLDTRAKAITTRAGLKRDADIVLDKHDNDVLLYVANEKPRPVCVLVDEAQFLTARQIDGLAEICDVLHVPVICYGLKTDFQMNLFEGSKRLLEIADKIEEIKTICFFCEKKAIFNLRLQHGKPIFEGSQIVVGDTKADDDGMEYKPVCRRCFKKARGQEYQLEDWSAFYDEVPFKSFIK